MGTTVRRLTAAMAVTATILAWAAAPAGAQDVPVLGTFTGSGSFDFSCNPFREMQTGSGDWTGLGTVTFSLDFCVEFPPVITDPWPITGGTFTITTPGGTLTGDMGGTTSAASPEPDGRFPFSYELTVTGGTGDLAGATGQLTLDGLLEFLPPFGRNIEGTVSGTLTTPAHTPTFKDDCKQDGWRTLTDETGAAFRNQGDCVSWANAHL
jgi:hypothetical protein